MKKKLFLLLLCFSNLQLVNAQTYYPSVSLRNREEIKIVSVTRNPSTTIVKFEYCESEPEKGDYIFLSPPNTDGAFYIKASGIIFKLLKTEGISNEAGKTLVYPNKPIRFSAIFEPLPSSITKFDIMEGTTDGTWHFYGVDLSGKIKINNTKSDNISVNQGNSSPNVNTEQPIAYSLTLTFEAFFKSSNDGLGNVLCTIPVGTKIGVYSKENGYYKVNYNGRIGYVNEIYFTQNNNSTNGSSSTSIKKFPSQNPTDEEGKKMDSWLNSRKDEIVQKWGPPSKVSTDGKGGEVYIYEETHTINVLPGQAITIQNDGKWVLPEFRNNTYYNEPVKKVITHSRMFYINPEGIIYYWLVKDREGY